MDWFEINRMAAGRRRIYFRGARRRWVSGARKVPWGCQNSTIRVWKEYHRGVEKVPWGYENNLWDKDNWDNGKFMAHFIWAQRSTWGTRCHNDLKNKLIMPLRTGVPNGRGWGGNLICARGLKHSPCAWDEMLRGWCSEEFMQGMSKSAWNDPRLVPEGPR